MQDIQRSNTEEPEVRWFGIKKQRLPVEFAGKVLKLEMQMDKGSQHVTIDDIKCLMDLYTQAIEYYNSNQQPDRQRYYEK